MPFPVYSWSHLVFKAAPVIEFVCPALELVNELELVN